VPLRDEDGKILKWFGVLTDIEDRKRSEEALRRSEKELRDLFENIPAVAFYARPDGFNEFQSRAWFEYSGQRVEDSLGYGWTATVHPDDLKSVATKLAKDWERGEPFEEEIRYRSKTGEYRSFLARVAPLRDESGKVLPSTVNRGNGVGSVLSAPCTESGLDAGIPQAEARGKDGCARAPVIHTFRSACTRAFARLPEESLQSGSSTRAY